MATLTKQSAKTPVKTASTSSTASAASSKAASAKSASRAEEQKRKKTGASAAVASPASSKKDKEQPAAKVADQSNQLKDKSEKEKDKPKKVKLVRDSFTMPEDEYQALGDIKKACVKAGFEIKKSELLRIGVALLKKVPAQQIQESLSALTPLKAGRPKKEK